ncbi:MAG: Ig-like domain repeat protein [Terracidiphilus sp.]
MKRIALLFLLGSALARPATAQSQYAPLVTQPIDESSLVTLEGSLQPLAQPRYDRGAVADSFSVPRMLLMLNRPPERESALQQFLQAAHTRGSAGYHRWLTPDEFGRRFGPTDADLQTVSAWLTAHGFLVTKIAKSRQFIEFSGTAGALRTAFHSEIHQYEIDGDTHYANSSDLKIPAALAPLVKGVSPLNDFRAKPEVEDLGQGLIARGSKPATPQWTAPNQYGTSNPYEFTVAPEDFETQYDLAPLYQAGIDGAGQTIAIINESNIDLSLVEDFQKLFGIAGAAPQVVIDGDDPGNLEGVDVEAYLDVETSGAVAPKATVDLYIASAGSLVEPLELAALRAVEDNQASVLSVSFGQCEYFLGSAGNQFWASLWEQAAAQGQTVFVSSGDSGSECDFQPLWVSGLASTPWNVAVGGTDFYYSDYASGGASANSLWNTTNDANLGSLKAPLPEQPWDDPFGLNVIPNSIERGETAAGGGGASGCITVASGTVTCAGGYKKPSWQSGPGVPADAARDMPDVSLYASNGANLSAYAICAFEGQCASGSGANAQVELVGGTSASSPAMAGIMALIDQKYGRQGQANFTLYPLAQQKPAAFHDITLGSNSVPCGLQIDANCVLQANGFNGTPQYPAGPGYDLASGLGSVDANLLVNDWNAITFQPTATTLRLSSASIVHGTPVTITASVAPSSGTGTPTGDVAVLTNSALPASQSQLFITLNGGTGNVSGVNYLPGGEYQLTGSYGGDGTYASSTSQPVPLTVTPEASNINFSMTSITTTVGAGGSVYYNAPFQLNIQPAGTSAGGSGKTDGIATGSATFIVDSTTATVALNGAGIASWLPPALSIGTHTASATYSGDSSFKASSAAQVNFSVAKGAPFVNMYILNPESQQAPEYDIAPGGSLTVSAIVGPYVGLLTGGVSPIGTAAPTGTVTFCLTTNPNVAIQACTSPVFSQTAALATPNGMYSLYATATATFSNLTTGYYQPEFVYSGDTNWQADGLDYLVTVAVQPLMPLAPSTVSLSISPDSISGTQDAQLTTSVTGGLVLAPTGEVFYYDNDVFLGYDILVPATTGATSSDQFLLGTGSFWNSGANQLTAVYLGDGNYAPSTSNVLNVTATQTAIGDFTLAAQSPQLSVASGASATMGLNLASLSGFNGSVSLACTPSSAQFSCSIAPGSVTVSGAATATVTIDATLPTTALATPLRQPHSRWPLAAGTLAFCMLLVRPRKGRAFLTSAMLCLALSATMAISSCGGGSSTGSNKPPPANGTPAGTYSILVTGTGNGIVHDAKIGVVVH